MNNDKISQNRRLLYDAVSDLNKYKYAAAIRKLRKAAEALADNVQLKKLDDVESRYFYMLRYISTYALCEQKDIDDIASKIKDIAAELSRDIVAGDNTMYGAQLRFERLRPEENLQSIISDYLSEAERLRTDTSALIDSRSHAALERLSIDIFNRLWTNYRLDDDTHALLDDILADTSISAVDRELWINALGLSLFYYPDRGVVNLLLKALSAHERRIHIAAAVWLLLFVTAFAGNIGKELEQTIWNHIHQSALDIIDVYRQIIQKVSDKGKDLFHDLSSLSQRFRGLNLSDAEALKNIDLSSDDYDTIKRFNEAQTSGADVFGQSIGNMRYFPFFATLANWFIPFDSRHSLLADITDGEGAEIAESIAMMPHIADSDKYALLLSMSQMPLHMRSQALSSIVDGMRSMSDTPEFKDAMSAIRNVPDSALVANQILQISRFVTKYPKVKEFPIAGVWPADHLFAPEHLLSAGLSVTDYLDLAKYLYKYNNITPARRIIDHIVDQLDLDNLSVDDLEMLAVVSDKSFAEDCLKEILRRDPGRMDIAIKLARRFIDSGTPDRAIDILKDSGVESSNDLEALFCLADCYEAASDFDKAIDTLHQADYIAPDNDSRARLGLAVLYLKNNLPHESVSTIDLIGSEDRKKLRPGIHGIALWLCGNTGEAIRIWSAEMASVEKDAKLQYIADLRRNIRSLSTMPVAADAAYRGLCVAPDILLYQIIGSKFGNI